MDQNSGLFGTDLSASNALGQLTSLGKVYAQAKYAPGSLTAVPQTQASDGTMSPADQPAPVTASNSFADTLAKVFQPIAAAKAADIANKNLNANPPYWLYAAYGVAVLVPLWIIFRRK